VRSSSYLHGGRLLNWFSKMAASAPATGDSDMSVRWWYDLRERKERTVGRRGVKAVTMVEGIVRST